MAIFELTEDQKNLQETARAFARNEMMPLAAEYDQSGKYPIEIIKKAHEVGLLGLGIPTEYGGMGLSLLDQVIVNEELSYGCSGMQTAIGAIDLAVGPVLIAGNEDQLNTFVKPITERPVIAAYCVTEPGAGSDVQNIRTTVKPTSDGYIINGEKMWITNGSKAEWYYLLATLDPGSGYKGMCSFVFPADLPGIQPGKKEINMGQRCSDTRSIVFKDVKIPKSSLLGKEGDGFKTTMKAFDLSRPVTATAAVGVAQCAFDHAVRYSKERKTFGTPIFEHQAVSFMLADMATSIEAARLLVRKSAFEFDQGRRNTKFASMAKCFAGDAAMKVATDAVQIFGGYGYSCEYPVEKLMRDAKIFQIYEGTQQIQRLIVAKHL